MSDSILKHALSPSVLRACRNADAQWFDGKSSTGEAPSDLGEHMPIPDEAVLVDTTSDDTAILVYSEGTAPNIRRQKIEQESSIKKVAP